MKKVLVITYYWPPSGGAGVQRWLKFVKYLPEFGWEPVVYTPENPESPADDHSLFKDIRPGTTVVKKKIFEPYRMYKRFLGMKPEERINAGFLTEQEKPGIKEKIAVWIRGNCFIPDARTSWIKPSVRFLKKYLTSNPVHAVITTGPPHSMHLIGLGLKRSLQLPWIADFRDPWTDIDFYEQLRLTRRADRKHRRLEKAVLNEADAVVVVGPSMSEKFTGHMEKLPYVIPNGYDPDDFNRLKPDDKADESGEKTEGPPNIQTFRDKFRFIHLGAMNRDRNHEIFWRALSELNQEDGKFKADLSIVLIGKLDISVRESIRNHDLEEKVIREPYIPHDRVADYLRSASLLYLPVNNTPNAKSIQTGKLFEYLAAGRPILGIGPDDGDAAEIIRDCQSGQMVNFTDLQRLKQVISDWYRQWSNHSLTIDSVNIEKYSRRTLTGQMAELLNKLTEKS